MEVHPFEIPLQRIRDEITDAAGVTLYMLRTDLNHPYISGNKLFKLRHNLQAAAAQGKTTLLTFGGAYSNHIAATAAAGREYGFATAGIIRGEQPAVLNEVLQFAARQGMQLHFITREEYRRRHDAAFTAELLGRLSDAAGITPSAYYVVPEGGANRPGVKGCMEIRDHIPLPFDLICCACGTGTTLAGIVLSLQEGQRALGFQVLKAEGYIYKEVRHWLQEFEQPRTNWEVNESYHLGGYAKQTPALLAFIRWFELRHAVPLDAVYTGKLMYGVYEEIREGAIAGSTIVAVHTGGFRA